MLGFYFMGKLPSPYLHTPILNRYPIEIRKNENNLVGGRYIEESWPEHVRGAGGRRTRGHRGMLFVLGTVSRQQEGHGHAEVVMRAWRDEDGDDDDDEVEDETGKNK